MTPEQQIVRMQENIEQLTDDVGEIKGVLHQVKEAIMGNPVGGDGGLAGRLLKLEKKVEAYERLKWIVIGASVTSGLAMGEIFEIINKLFN